MTAGSRGRYRRTGTVTSGTVTVADGTAAVATGRTTPALERVIGRRAERNSGPERFGLGAGR